MGMIELKSIITEIKNSLEGLNNRFELADPVHSRALLCDLKQTPDPLWACVHDHMELLHAILLEESEF